MSWYDYVPVAGSIARLAQGDYKQAGIDALGPLARGAYDGYNAYSGAMDEQRQGLKTASEQARALGDKQRAFQMEGLNKAQNYYLPAQEMLKNVYGAPGSMRK